ncbi:MAG: lactate dehydrogenase-like 2-hydroxyacid dehydrogenase [Granulosicoccus sp.]|jgi:lactate dehydrogenase-like 2-hydroxyacid dehydrogenase
MNVNTDKKKKIVLTRRWPQAVEELLCKRYDTTLNESDKPFTHDDMKHALQSADAVLTTVTDKLDATIFENLTPNTSIIANYGVGYSHIDLDSARSSNIVVTNTPDVLSECTADLSLTLMLMVSRRAGEGERELRSGQWTGWRPTHLMGSKFSGKTLGIVGYGRIGRETARRAHHGFGMDIQVFNRSKINPDVLLENSATQIKTLNELLESVDYVSLHCPGGAENRHLIDSKRLALLKPTAYIINTARGEVIDQEALILALEQNQIAGAGLDVFDGEPVFDQRLIDCENAVLLPHLGSATTETREAMGFRVVKNLVQHFKHLTPPDRVA